MHSQPNHEQNYDRENRAYSSHSSCSLAEVESAKYEQNQINDQRTHQQAADQVSKNIGIHLYNQLI